MTTSGRKNLAVSAAALGGVRLLDVELARRQRRSEEQPEAGVVVDHEDPLPLGLERSDGGSRRRLSRAPRSGQAQRLGTLGAVDARRNRN